LIEKLSALPDKTSRVVKSAGPWDGLNEPSLIYDGYVDKEYAVPSSSHRAGRNPRRLSLIFGKPLAFFRL
jgi:hypothetical protein